MKKALLFVSCLFFLNIGYCQYNQLKSVAPVGGNINNNQCLSNGIVSISVAGEMAVSTPFSVGVYSGSIGYLDVSDSVSDTCVVSQVKTVTRHSDVVSLFPNPNPGSFVVSINTTEDWIASLVITDVLGRIVSTREINLTVGDNRLNYYSLSPGIYLLRVQSAELKQVIKIIVE